MYRTLMGLLLAGSVALPTAFAQPCAKPADVAAFDTAGLKSQLMVIALTCNMRDRYNDFVVRYRPDLAQQERALSSYFSRSFGRRGQQAHDDYITSLANAQSMAGLRDGTLFCQRNAGLFNEVLGLPRGMSLSTFAGGKNFVQPVDVVACPAAPARTRMAAAATTHR